MLMVTGCAITEGLSRAIWDQVSLKAQCVLRPSQFTSRRCSGFCKIFTAVLCWQRIERGRESDANLGNHYG